MSSFVGQLGKQPAEHDVRTLQMASYLTEELPPPPARARWTRRVHDWQMLGNDHYGDCVLAGALHMVQDWTAYASREFEPTTDQALEAYSALTGFDPDDPNTDRGANMLQALRYWRSVGIGGHSILAFAACEPGNTEHIKDSIELFQAAYVGISLPVSAKHEAVWSLPPGGPVGDAEPGSWGGHCVPIIGYSARSLTCVTWGRLQRMTWPFFSTYCDEAYAVLSRDWLRSDSSSPSGFDLAALQRDLAAIPH